MKRADVGILKNLFGEKPKNILHTDNL